MQVDADQTVFLARQPIYDADLNIFGYELLHRDLEGIAGGTQITAQLLHTAFLDMSISTIAADHPIFINFDTESLAAELSDQLCPERCVIEVLETVAMDEQILPRIIQLRERGFRIALDDWRPDDPRSRLLPHAQFVKLDWPHFTRPELAATVRRLERGGVQLLAEKIEREDEFAFAKSLGITLFQGYLFARPTRIEGRRIPAWMRTCLQVFHHTASQDFDVNGCVKLVERDPMLCHKLLRFVNSSSLGSRQEISSIRSALSYIGRKGVRRLVTQVLRFGASPRPAPEMTLVLMRAKFSELLMQHAGGDADTGFLAGLLRGLHENLELPLPQLMQDLSVSPELREALLSGTGMLADVLQAAIDYDNPASQLCTPTSIHPVHLQSTFLSACQWTDQLLDEAKTACL